MISADWIVEFTTQNGIQYKIQNLTESAHLSEFRRDCNRYRLEFPYLPLPDYEFSFQHKNEKVSCRAMAKRLNTSVLQKFEA